MHIGIGIGVDRQSSNGGASSAIASSSPPIWYREDVALTPSSGTLTDWDNQGSLGGDVVPGGSPPTNGATGVVFTDGEPNMSTDETLGAAVSASAWTCAIVANPVSHTSTAAAAYARPSFTVDDGGYWGVHVKSGGGSDVTVTVHQWDTGSKTCSLSFPENVRRVILAWYDGVNINLTVDGVGTATPTAAASLGSVAGVLRLGDRLTGVTAGTYENRLEEIAIWNTTLSSSDRAAVIAELKARHGL